VRGDGFSRGKNAGAVVAKGVLNFSVASLTWLAVGFAPAFGGGARLAGTSGFFRGHRTVLAPGSPIAGPLERIRFIAYPIYGVVFAGLIVVVSVLVIDRRLDDPVGALSAHGVAGVWDTLSCGLFSSPRLVGGPDVVGDPGLFYTGSLTQLGVQALGVSRPGSTVEHGMYGYPEQYVDSYDLEPAP
jgi:ammonia channel protein AmtB